MTEENKQKILVEFAYNGTDFHGLAYQDNKTDTISKQITDSMINTKLIPDREFSEIQFIGRTDKGVSAIKNCCSVFVRKFIYKKMSKGEIVKNKLPYCKIMNSKLPRNIRAIKFAIVGDEFSCLGMCIKRGYKYYITNDTKQSNNERGVCKECSYEFNLENVKDALNRIKGEHDFRNLCKVNFDNCKTYNRIIYKAEIKKIIDFDDGIGKFSVYELYLEANGFLWHLVRNIASVLMKVGTNLETPDIIDFLLNIEKCNIKPNYQMGSPYPLILCHYEFKNEDEIKWEYECKDYMIYQINQTREAVKKSFYNFIVWGNIENAINNNNLCDKEDMELEQEDDFKTKKSKHCCKNTKSIRESINSKEQTFEEKHEKYLNDKRNNSRG